jgi:N-dimethylarginine dimethylaminohydrolase
VILAGHGFRTDPRAHAEAARVLDREVVPLELVDPCYYHLDTAVAVLDATTVAWLPEAFTPASRAVLRDRFPDAVVADRVDAAVLGLNAVSDGRHVVLPAAAARLAAALADRGFVPVPVDCSELLRGGGGPKCCTLEVRA